MIKNGRLDLIKIILCVLALYCLLPATVFELYYDCGNDSGTGDAPFVFGYLAKDAVRVRFTPPIDYIDATVTQIKVCWRYFVIGGPVAFRATIREQNSGYSVTSDILSAPNENIWTTYDLTSLNYRTTENDFYIELVPETTSGRVDIRACGHDPIDWRSQRRNISTYIDWTDLDHDYFIHVFLDDTGSKVTPTSLGSIKALYQ
jgi:hypothetical protein